MIKIGKKHVQQSQRDYETGHHFEGSKWPAAQQQLPASCIGSPVPMAIVDRSVISSKVSFGRGGPSSGGMYFVSMKKSTFEVNPNQTIYIIFNVDSYC